MAYQNPTFQAQFGSVVELVRGPRPQWTHSWRRTQQRFVNDGGVSNVVQGDVARKTYDITWSRVSGSDRQILLDLQTETSDFSEPFTFRPPDTEFPTILVAFARDAEWANDSRDAETTDRVTFHLIEVLS